MSSRGEEEYRLLYFCLYTIVPKGYFPLLSFLCSLSFVLGLDPKVY